MKRLSFSLALCLSSLIAAVAAAQPPSAPEHKDKRQAFARLKELLKKEPSIREVQKMTLDYYKLDPGRINALSSAAAIKSLFPEIDAGFDQTINNDNSLMNDGLFPTLSYKEKTQQVANSQVWHVRGVWDLSRLVYNPEQLDIKSLNSLQETLIREVTTMYFSRRRTMAALVLSPPADEEDLYYDRLRLQEMTATLDAFTGGKFAGRAWDGEGDNE
jgi:hypothetical protein